MSIVHDLHTHFEQLAARHRLPRYQTDGIKAGKEEDEIKGIAVSWKASFANLKKAQALGLNLFVAHESLYATGGNGLEDAAVSEAEKPMRDWIAENKMTVYRCHDNWDLVPGVGVLDSWQRQLNFPVERLLGQSASGYIRAFSVVPGTLSMMADCVLNAVKPFGQNGVDVIGDWRRKICSLTITCGAGGSMNEMLAFNTDLIIRTNDFFTYVRDGYLAENAGRAMVLVNHGASEEEGIRNLGAYIAQQFPSIHCRFIPGRCIATVKT